MSDAKEGSTPPAISFSENEMKLLSYAWLCFDVEPKINFDVLAPLCGYTVGSAKTTLNKIKRKIKALGEEAGAATGMPAATPKKPAATPKATPKKRAAKVVDNEDDAESQASPLKKMKATPKPRGKKAAAKVADEEDGMMGQKTEPKAEVKVKNEVVDEEGDETLAESLFGPV